MWAAPFDSVPLARSEGFVVSAPGESSAAVEQVVVPVVVSPHGRLAAGWNGWPESAVEPVVSIGLADCPVGRDGFVVG